MKHTWKITLLLAGLFLASQLLGLFILYNGFSVGVDELGRPVLMYQETVIGPRPELQGPEALALILFSVALGTGLILLVIRLGVLGIWKAFFFFAAFLSMWVAMAVLIGELAALGLAVLAALLKLRSRSVLVHNLTEPLMYAGIAFILVPLLSVAWALALLAAISVYDFWAVFRSKHMVTMAKGLQDSTVFAGLSIPYRESGKIEAMYENGKKPRARKGDALPEGDKSRLLSPHEREEITTAALGGGDIAFPLLFTGAVMQALALSGMAKATAFLVTLILPAVLTFTLVLMLWKATKKKFYPAMPVLSVGCLAGYLLILGIAGII